MIRRLLPLSLPVLLFAGLLPAHAQPSVQETPLIERAKIFGNPSKSGGRISPDGQWLSWIAPRDGKQLSRTIQGRKAYFV